LGNIGPYIGTDQLGPVMFSELLLPTASYNQSAAADFH